MDLSQQLTVLRPRLLLIILVTVIAGVLSFALASLIPKTYEAQATLLVGQVYNTSQQSQPPQINYDSFLASEQLATTLSRLVDTRPFLAKVTARLGLTDDLTAMRNRVDAQAAAGSLFIAIAARAADDASAAKLAEAVADELVAEAPTVLVNGGTTKPEDVVTIVDPAVASEAVRSPKVTLYAALGAMTALIVAIATLFILAYRESPQPRRGPAARRVGPREPLAVGDQSLAAMPAALAPIGAQARPPTSPGTRPAAAPEPAPEPLLLTEVQRPAPVIRDVALIRDAPPPFAQTVPANAAPAPAGFRVKDRTLLRPRPTPATKPAPVLPAPAPAPPAAPAPRKTSARRPAATEAAPKTVPPSGVPLAKAALAKPAPGNEAKPGTRARPGLTKRPPSD